MCAVPSAPGAASVRSGTLCHGDGAHGRGHRRRRAFMLPILWLSGWQFSTANMSYFQTPAKFARRKEPEISSSARS